MQRQNRHFKYEKNNRSMLIGTEGYKSLTPDLEIHGNGEIKATLKTTI